jgi:hypothetical protein
MHAIDCLDGAFPLMRCAAQVGLYAAVARYLRFGSAVVSAAMPAPSQGRDAGPSSQPSGGSEADRARRARALSAESSANAADAAAHDVARPDGSAAGAAIHQLGRAAGGEGPGSGGAAAAGSGAARRGALARLHAAAPGIRSAC